MSIQTSCLARKISIGGRSARLAPPTIRQAVEILHVLKNIEEGSDVDLLFELLAGLEWKGYVDLLVYLRNLLDNEPTEFAKLIQNILLQGYDPVKHTRETKKEKTSEPDWKALISQYCRVYPGRDAYGVYNSVPFPFFMEMLPEARKEEAIRHIHAALENQFAFGGSEETMERWRNKAGLDIQEEEKEDAYSEELTDEQIKENKQAFKKRLQNGV